MIIAALEFATPAMLGWSALAAAPFLINYWIRRRHVEMPWAAMDLLTAAVRQRSRQIRLRQWLLLLMRSGILLLAALAAAQPMWKSAGATEGSNERTHHVLVIDHSASMACVRGGRSRLEAAKRRARDIVENAPVGDAFTVITWSERADSALGRAMFETPRVLAAIESIEPVDTMASLSAALHSAKVSVAVTREQYPELAYARVAFLTDMGANTWSDALPKRVSADGSDESSKTEAGQAWLDLANTADITIESVDDGVRDNVLIADVETEPVGPTVDQPFTVSVRLSASGVRGWEGVPIEVWLDGVSIGSKTAAVRPGESVQVRFEARVPSAGNHVIEARLIEGADPLAVDNRRWRSFQASAGQKAICFADDPAAAEDIARALNPKYQRGEGGVGISVELAATAALSSTELSEIDAVFLCDIAQLTKREQHLVKEYVESGGAVVFVLGARTKSQSLNQFLNSRAEDSTGKPETLMPVRIADQPVSGDWRLDPLGYQHAVLSPFEGRSRAGLLGVHVSKYFPVAINGDRVVTALGLTSGDPAIVTKDFGRGRVALMAIDPALRGGSEPWSTLAVSPSFVPLVRELFAYVTSARRGEQLNRMAGEMLIAPTGTDGAGGRLQWRTPGGQTSGVAPEARHSGIYTVTLKLPKTGDEANSATTAIAVNVDPGESDLATIDAATLRPLAGGGRRVDSQTAAFGGRLELTRYLLCGAALLLLVELTAAWLFGKGWT
jgi:hypothetical protein